MRIYYFVFVIFLLTACAKNTTANKPLTINTKDYSYCELKHLQVIFQPDADKYYLSFSKRAGEQGDVITRLYINKQGTVDEARLLQSSSFPRLDRSALEISKRYEFRPFLKVDEPINCYTNMLIKFKLNNINTDKK